MDSWQDIVWHKATFYRLHMDSGAIIMPGYLEFSLIVQTPGILFLGMLMVMVIMTQLKEFLKLLMLVSLGAKLNQGLGLVKLRFA